MVRACLALSLVACGFSGHAVEDAPPPVIDVLAPDAGPLCTIKTTASGFGGSLGNVNAGTLVAAPAEQETCVAPDERVVGMRFDVTPAKPPGWTEEVVVGTRVRCGRIEKLPSGEMHTVKTTLLGFDRGMCSGWGTNVIGTEVDCPDGQVLVAANGNLVTDSNNPANRTQFNSLVINCAPFDAVGHAMNSSAMSIDVLGTYSYGDRPQSAGCALGESIAGAKATAGCGEDSMTFLCATTTCQ